MFKSLAILFVSTLTIAGASAQEIDCNRVDDADDWTITINSRRTMASFFDNDHNEAMKMIDMKIYETYPTQTEYTFAGQDGSVADRFIVNQFSMTGTLYLGVKRSGKYSRKVEFACAPVKKSYINWKEVKKALDDAPSNGGSTRY